MTLREIASDIDWTSQLRLRWLSLKWPLDGVCNLSVRVLILTMASVRDHNYGHMP